MANIGPEGAAASYADVQIKPKDTRPLCPHASLIRAFIEAAEVVDITEQVLSELEWCLEGAVDAEEEEQESLDPKTGREWETLEPYLTEGEAVIG